MALAGLSAVFLFEMLDNSILNVALPTIGRELHASTTALNIAGTLPTKTLQKVMEVVLIAALVLLGLAGLLSGGSPAPSATAAGPCARGRAARGAWRKRATDAPRAGRRNTRPRLRTTGTAGSNHS